MQQITIELLQDVDAIPLKRLLYFLVKSNGFSLTTLILLYCIVKMHGDYVFCNDSFHLHMLVLSIFFQGEDGDWVFLLK